MHNGVIKLTDFGSSKYYLSKDYSLTRSLRGSPYWMAPEVVERKGHLFPADVWSFGCVLIEMFTGRPPWSNVATGAKEVLNLISTKKLLPDIPVGSTNFNNLVMLCL